MYFFVIFDLLAYSENNLTWEYQDIHVLESIYAFLFLSCSGAYIYYGR
jgi:hypothetical protein